MTNKGQKIGLLLPLAWVIHFIAYGQFEVNFNLPEDACKEEVIFPSNISTGATDFQWQFCAAGLLGDLSAQPSVNISGALAPDGISIQQESGNWYGFSLGTNSSNLVRLDFGPSLASDPIVTDLGNPGGLLLRPRNIAMIKSNGLWYALITNFDPVSSLARIVRLNFGTSLTNPPAATDLGSFGGRLTQPFAIKWKVDNGNLVALVGDRSQRKILMVNFGNNPEGIPSQAGDFLEALLPAPGFFKDFDIIRFNNQWQGLGVSENGAIQKLTFSNSLFSLPFVTVITQDVPPISSPSNVLFLRDQTNFAALVTEFGGNIIRLSFGKNPQINIPAYTNLGQEGVLQNNQGLALIKIDNQWIGFSHNTSTSRLNRIQFSQSCAANPLTSTAAAPSVSLYRPSL